MKKKIMRSLVILAASGMVFQAGCLQVLVPGIQAGVGEPIGRTLAASFGLEGLFGSLIPGFGDPDPDA